jgi:hypothetical protein
MTSLPSGRRATSAAHSQFASRENGLHPRGDDLSRLLSRTVLVRQTTQLAVICLLLLGAGCTSTTTSNTARTAKEQMLLSNAVDQSLAKVDFTPLSGQRVFIEEKYLDCVDKGYVLGSIRHQVMRSGGTLTAAADDADVIMEIRSGGVGTDTTDAFIGIPEITLPGMLTLPEIRFTERKTQYGYSKLGLVLMDAKTKTVLGDGGMSMAQADDNNWYVLGMGPWQNGSLKSDVATARRIPHGMRTNRVPTQVAFDSPDGHSSGTVRYASEAREQQVTP